MTGEKRVNCCTCGVEIVMSQPQYDDFRRTGRTFHCVNGHAQHFTEGSEKKLRDRISFLESRLAAEERDNESLRGEVKRLEHAINGYKGTVQRMRNAREREAAT